MYRVFGEYVVPWVSWYDGTEVTVDTLYGVNRGIDVGIRSVPCIRGSVVTMSTWYHGNHGVHGIMVTMVYIVYVVRC